MGDQSRDQSHIRLVGNDPEDRSPQQNTPDRPSISSVSTSTDSDAAATHLRLGIDYPLDSEDEEVEIQAGRIKKIENLGPLKKLKVLKLIANVISEMGGLETCSQLEHLELYQNSVSKISQISHLKNLKILDLSFNEIRKIEEVDSLLELTKLYLSSNKVGKMENLSTLTKLTLLELGSNRIRTIEGIDALVHLEELWLGRNKITSMAIPPLPCLRLLSLQSCRLTDWDPSVAAINSLEELYLSHNRLSCPPNDFFASLTKLTTIDLSGNQIDRLDFFSCISSLEELWLNDNKVKDPNEIKHISNLKNLQTVYLERNPLQEALGPAYRTVVREAAPWIRQIDAILLDQTTVAKVHSGSKTTTKPIMKSSSQW